MKESRKYALSCPTHMACATKLIRPSSELPLLCHQCFLITAYTQKLPLATSSEVFIRPQSVSHFLVTHILPISVHVFWASCGI